jgi:hypothetical protein
MFMDRHHVQQVCLFFATKFSLHERSRDSPFNMYGDHKIELKYQGTTPDCFIHLELYSPYLEGSVAPFVGIVTRNSSHMDGYH